MLHLPSNNGTRFKRSGERKEGLWSRVSSKVNLNFNSNFPIGVKSVTGWMFWTHFFGLIFCAFGMMTVYWVRNNEGLWTGLYDTCKSESFPVAEDQLLAMRIIMVVGCVFYTFAFVCVVLHSFIAMNLIDPSVLVGASIAFCFIAAIGVSTSAGMYVSQVRKNLGYSFLSAIFSIVLAIVSGGMGIIHILQG